MPYKTFMRKLLSIFAYLLLALWWLSPTTLAQSVVKYQGLATKGNVQASTQGMSSTNKLLGSYPGCTVTVYLTGTTTVASIYTTSTLTPKANPFTADSEGYFEFYLYPGTYDIRFSGTGITTPFTRSGVVITLASSNVPTGVYNVVAYGARADATSATGSISSSSTTLTCPACTFTAADTGKVVYVPGAGASGVMLKTTGTYASTTTLTLAASASTTVSSSTFYYGTDNTTYFQNAIDAANTAGGGNVYIPGGKYIITYVSLAKKIDFEGANRAATILWSAASSGGIVRSIWPSNASTSVDIVARNFTIVALDTRSVQYGIHDNGGSHVLVENVGIFSAHYGIVYDQTEISRIIGCNITSYQATYHGIMSGKLDPATNGGWTKTGAGTTGTDSGLWLLTSTGLNTVNTYTKALGSDAFVKGFLLIGSKGVSVAGAENAGFDDAKLYRVDNGTYRYDLQFTSTQIRLNGGTARSFNATSNWRLEIAAGGATASLTIDGTVTDTGIAGLSTAGSAIVGFGDFTTTDDASVYYGPLTYVSSYRIPADIWLVNGAAITPGNVGAFTNVIQIRNNHLNSNSVHVIDDGGTDHVIAENNINGGLWAFTVSGTVNLTIQDNAIETAQWETIYVHTFNSMGTSAGTPSGLKFIKNTINNSVVTRLPPVRLIAADVVSLDTNVWTKSPSQGYLVDLDRGGVGRIEAPNESVPNGPDSIFETTALQSLTGNANDLAVGPFEIAYITTDASRTVTGFSGGKDRRVVTLYNTGSNDLVLAHQSASSTAANRMISATALDLTIGAGQAVRLTYDSAALRWRAIPLQ